MKVLLGRDIDNLGEMGDVVDVADGYARNYLLPKEYAFPPTADHMQRIESARRARERGQREEVKRIEERAQDLEGFLCVAEARANEKGDLFGSITAEIIADLLAENGFAGIRPSSILLDRPIEHVGDYPVEVMLLPEITVPITVRVTALE